MKVEEKRLTNHEGKRRMKKKRRKKERKEVNKE